MIREAKIRTVYSRPMRHYPSRSSRLHRWALRLWLALGFVAMGWTSSLATEGSQVASNNPPAVVDSSRQKAWYAMSTERFGTLPEAGKPIEFATLDRELLAAAIFHATNLQRVKSRLAPLAHDPAASEAARLQATVMAAEKFLGHENDFDAALKTPLDRIRKVGLRPGHIAENVALEFGRKYRSGEPFYTREENGKTVFSASPDGPPIPMHSYVSFAAALLEGWMDSPGHRANILSDRPRRLGCAAAPAQDPTGLEVFYCAQVFFTPIQ